MPEYIAQRIHNGMYVGDPILFEAAADPMRSDDTDLIAAERVANDGMDLFTEFNVGGRMVIGVWVDVKPKPKKTEANA